MVSDGTRVNVKTDEIVHPKIIKDKVTNTIKLEETLIDYMEIIISLNQKLNNHISTTRTDLHSLEAQVGQN